MNLKISLGLFKTIIKEYFIKKCILFVNISKLFTLIPTVYNKFLTTT